MTAGQPTVGIFSPIGPSTAPSARAASGVSVRPSGGISTGATRCGPGRLARRAYGSGVRYTVIYQATCADICPLFRSERTERLQYLTPMAMRNAIGRAKLHGRPPALPSARSPTPCRVPSPPRRLTRRPSPPQPPAAPWRSPTSSSNRRPRGLREREAQLDWRSRNASIILGVLYESYIHPITILSTLPSAGVGVASMPGKLTGQDVLLLG
jgi:hypothetical protein